MRLWRIAYLTFLLGGVALPLLWPLTELTVGGPVLAPRLLFLARNTGVLLLGTLALSLPLGTSIALLIERTDLPGGRAWLIFFVVALFVPLPLFLSGWQIVEFGYFGGMAAATILHAIVALPWVVWIVGLGLRSVEPELEEDALLLRPASWVVAHVTLRRTAPFLLAAALWVVAQTSGEIIITDLMQVRTFAEEVYVQLVAPENDDPVGRAVLASLCGVVVLVTLVVVLVVRIDRLTPWSDVNYRDTRYFHLGPWRWLALLFVASVALSLVGIPSVSLVSRAGTSSGSWSLVALADQLYRSLTFDLELLGRSLVVALVTGGLTATVALVGCWLARGARSFAGVLLAVLALAWAMPGPILGLGLLRLIPIILDFTDPFTRLPAMLLWYGPSIVPLLIVHFVRFLPFAAAIVWPTVKRIPEELFDLARLDGLSPSREFLSIVWPMARSAWWRALLAVAVLSLGELSAGKLVSTPRAESFAEALWTQMHYGITADLAARCLWLLGIVFVGALAVTCSTRRT